MHNWYMHLVKGLKAQGFHQSPVDPCLFIQTNCIIILYTDNCFIFGINDEVINAFLNDLKEEFILQDQGAINDYLGLCIDRMLNESSGTFEQITLTQTGIIDSILWDLGLIHNANPDQPCDPANPQAIPISKVLHPSPRSEPYNATAINYQSIIGKWIFLQKICDLTSLMQFIHMPDT